MYPTFELVSLVAVHLYFSLTELQSVTAKGIFYSLSDYLQSYSAVKRVEQMGHPSPQAQYV
jgi:hypothetical protein